MFMFRRNEQIKAQIEEFFGHARDSLKIFSAAMEHLLTEGVNARFRTYFNDAHNHESKADDIQMNIELMLYQKSLLPESRRDILVLIESVDDIPDLAEGILNQVDTQNITIPEFLHDDMRELVRMSLECFELVSEISTLVLSGKGEIRNLAEKVDSNESHCDKIEQKMIRDLFQSDLDKVDKLLIRDVVIRIGDISDLCENVENFLKIFHVKRQV